MLEGKLVRIFNLCLNNLMRDGLWPNTTIKLFKIYSFLHIHMPGESACMCASAHQAARGDSLCLYLSVCII